MRFCKPLLGGIIRRTTTLSDTHADTHIALTDKPIRLSFFHTYVWFGMLGDVAFHLGVDPDLINTPDPTTGLTALHIAVGRNNLEMTKLLLEHGPAFVPDGEGRMPSVIAAEMEVSDEL